MMPLEGDPPFHSCFSLGCQWNSSHCLLWLHPLPRKFILPIPFPLIVSFCHYLAQVISRTWLLFTQKIQAYLHQSQVFHNLTLYSHAQEMHLSHTCNNREYSLFYRCEICIPYPDAAVQNESALPDPPCETLEIFKLSNQMSLSVLFPSRSPSQN